MFTKADSAKKTAFLEQAKAAREERAQEKQREEAAVKIQATARGFISRRRLRNEIWREVDVLLEIPTSAEEEYKPSLKPALVTFAVVKRFLFLLNEDKDAEKFQYLCKYILFTMSSDQVKFSYVSVALSKSHVVAWIQQLKEVLWHCCRYLKVLKPESVSGIKAITVYLHMLLTFTSTTTWKILQGKAGEALKPGMSQLCNNVMGHLNSRGLYPVFQSLLIKGLARSKPSFTKGTLSAVITVAVRPLIAANFSDSLLTVFLLHILSVPAVVYHTSHLAQECLSVLVTHRMFKRSLDLLCNEQSTRIIFNSLEGNYALCLLANLIQLADAEIEGLVESTPNFLNVVNKLLECCERYVQSKKSNLTHWHPVLGWFSQKTDQSLHEAMPYVTKQLQLLWSPKIVKILLSDLLAHNQCKAREEQQTAARQQAKSTNIIKKALEKASTKSSSVRIKLNSPVALSTCAACGMYQTALRTLTQLRLDILAGLSYQDLFLPNLWSFFCDFGPNCGLNAFIELLTSSPNNTHHPVFQMLTLFCDAASHLIVILDDVELYEQQKPFKLENVVAMTSFLNQFIFKLVWNNLIDVTTAASNPLFSSPHTLLMLLYERDCRRPFTPDKHWLIRDIKPSTFLQELDRGRKTAQFLLQKTPHIIPHKERVILFRKNVQKEKEVLGLTESVCASPTSTLVTVHRARIIEDGYRQLSLVPPGALKGIIRVRFINAQGLDEAGIDQDGVFKEFLEETISRVFDPSLNLFKVTSDQKLYPSPTSAIQDNHLTLFEFVGRMLGKAVYEGIVVDVPFAPFFLTQILGRTYSSTYSFMDELPSLDPELYKNLTYIKHYEGDVCDIELTFSSSEDYLGQLVTHELVPGGKAISVTNENKISYVHHMAHFRMHVQIKEQTAAFIRGFKSIVNPDWLLMFSAPELQKLISGDNTDMDIEDLKAHTQYYGGFHSSHKVVNWLWDILVKDFTREERSLFLKFVTSCSKPPLLGFAHLEPPFSIRCVEVSDDQDTGDTVGSVLKGFFNIRKKDPVGRLPTSSTCFNLLKLPNYQKKSTLREKLRYAITSNTGFELS